MNNNNTSNEYYLIYCGNEHRQLLRNVKKLTYGIVRIFNLSYSMYFCLFFLIYQI